MWFLHLAVCEDTNMFNEAAARFETKLFLRPNGGFECDESFTVQGNGYIAADEGKVTDFLADQDKVGHIENDGNYFFIRYMEPLDEERVRGLRRAYDPALIHVKPVRFTEDRWEEWFVAATDRETVASLVTASEELGVEYDVKALEERLISSVFSFHLSESLTERQRQVVSTARDIGYFDVPRSATVVDVAEALDMAQSTAHEHLQKAERSILDQTHL